MWAASALWPAGGVGVVIKGLLLGGVTIAALVLSGELGRREWRLLLAMRRPGEPLPKP
jgi:hypothetical protein